MPAEEAESVVELVAEAEVPEEPLSLDLEAPVPVLLVLALPLVALELVAAAVGVVPPGLVGAVLVPVKEAPAVPAEAEPVTVVVAVGAPEMVTSVRLYVGSGLPAAFLICTTSVYDSVDTLDRSCARTESVR